MWYGCWSRWLMILRGSVNCKRLLLICGGQVAASLLSFILVPTFCLVFLQKRRRAGRRAGRRAEEESNLEYSVNYLWLLDEDSFIGAYDRDCVGVALG